MEQLIPLITGIFGIFLGSYLTKKRDFQKTKKELRIKYLIEAYRKIEKGAMPVSKKFDKGDFESAIADIQLFGNPSQIHLAYKFCEEAAKGNGKLLQELLENLRNELRSEVKISNKNIPKISPFRIND